MAQVVEYFENNVVFAEGPFVICNPFCNGWRIEVELKGHLCPILPDSSIYEIMNRLGMVGKTMDKELAKRVCDTLNQINGTERRDRSSQQHLGSRNGGLTSKVPSITQNCLPRSELYSASGTFFIFIDKIYTHCHSRTFYNLFS